MQPQGSQGRYNREGCLCCCHEHSGIILYQHWGSTLSEPPEQQRHRYAWSTGSAAKRPLFCHTFPTLQRTCLTGDQICTGLLLGHSDLWYGIISQLRCWSFSVWNDSIREFYLILTPWFLRRTAFIPSSLGRETGLIMRKYTEHNILDSQSISISDGDVLVRPRLMQFEPCRFSFHVSGLARKLNR